jgi:hypothetical protein
MDKMGCARYHYDPYFWRMNEVGHKMFPADFVAGPQTRLIAIKVMRVPGNPLIKGTFWLDDVKLVAVSTPESNH